MIYEITREVEAELKAKGLPFPIKFGPEPKETTAITSPRVVFQSNDQAEDQFGAPRSQQRNPRAVGLCAIGLVVRIFAKSSAAGARVQDHERQARQIANMVVVALRKAIVARRSVWRDPSGKFLNAVELSMRGLEQWAGRVYELRLSVDAGVLDTDWSGAGETEGLISDVATAVA